MADRTSLQGTKVGDIISRCNGKTWQQVRDEGLLSALVAACGGARKTVRKMGWHWDGHTQGAIRDATGGFKREVAKTPHVIPEEAVTQLQGDLQQDVYRHLLGNPNDQHSIDSLADWFDVAPHHIREAVAALSAAGYNLNLHNDVLRLDRGAVGVARQQEDILWGEHKISIGVVSDSHCGNLCYCDDELQGAYDKFAAEGVAFVVHCGDLMDGPANRGPRPAHECRTDCFNAQQAVLWTRDNYPQREGLKTYFIESAQSHAGWELRKTGQSMGHMLNNGFNYFADGPREDGMKWEEGREDLHFLGYDEATLNIGPECNTRFLIRHPGGGTAYALSYNLQKWAEQLEGGTKPHVCAMGHYHKFCYIRSRNIWVASVDASCWQSPWMASKNIAAHVGFNIYDLSLDTDGTVREFVPRSFPYFFGEKRSYNIGMGGVA